MRTLPIAIALISLACSSNPQTPPATPAEPTPTPTEPATGPEEGGGAEEGATEGGGESGEGGGEEATAEGGEETRSTQTIQKVILDNRKPFRACYDKAKKDLPTLKGTMTIHFVLDPEGKIKKAELNQERSDLKSPTLVDCALAHLKTLKFPPSSKGMDTTVNYPFDFKPDGG